MKKIVFITVAVLFLSAGFVNAQMEHMMEESSAPGVEEDLCQMGFGPGMMGYGMRHGMMGYGMGPGTMGCCMMDFDKDEYEQFLEKTRDLRKEMHMKKFDYFEAMRSPEKNKEKIDKIRSEMKDIRNKMLKEMIK